MLLLFSGAGILCLVGALIGGGVKFANYELPIIKSSPARVGLALLGCVLFLPVTVVKGLPWWRQTANVPKASSNPEVKSMKPIDVTPQPTPPDTHEKVEQPSAPLHPAKKPLSSRLVATPNSHHAAPQTENPPAPQTTNGTDIKIENNAPNQGIQGCASGATCSQANNFGSPRPAPAARFTLVPAPEQTVKHYPSCANLPCVNLVLSANGYFAEPLFHVQANKAFTFVGAVEGSVSGYMETLRGVEPTYYPQPDGSVIVALENGPLQASHYLIVTIRGDIATFKITAVESVVR